MEKTEDKMYKLIAVDLDGTLLNSYGDVSEKTKESIKKAINKGIEVVICSGRVASSCENIAKEVGADNYIISGNGAQLYDIKNQKIIHDKYLSKTKVLDIIKVCDENSIYYNVYTDNLVITRTLNYNTIFYHNENKKKQEGKKTNINIVESPYKYIQDSDTNQYSKMTICDHDRVIFSGIIRKLRQIKGITVLDVGHMSRKIIQSGTQDIEIEYYYTEITSENVDKWTAIQVLIDKLNIKKEEVAAIGDNANDLLMIKNSGLGIAMGNSSSQIKEVADMVVSDNDSDGVAEAIDKIMEQ